VRRWNDSYVVNWRCEHLIDCFTHFARRDSYPAIKALHLQNPLCEATIIQNFQSPYSALSGADSASVAAALTGTG
jgi:hypothetical protein